MSASQLIHYLSSNPTALGVWASFPPDKITLNPVNEKTDQNHSDFQPAINAATHANLHTQQLISHTRTSSVDTTASLLNSDGRIIATSWT